MPIPLKDEGEFNSTKIAKGVYASLGTISKITDLSNHPSIKRDTPMARNDGTPYQLCIEVEYEREDGNKWTSRFWGEYDVDQVTGRIRGWNSFRNGVQKFFTTLYGSKEEVGSRINDDASMGETLFAPCIGKKFYRVSYINGVKDDGKGKYKDWDQIFLENVPIEEIQTAWAIASVNFKSYVPGAIDEIARLKDEKTGDTNFEYGANVKENSDPPEEEFEL